MALVIGAVPPGFVADDRGNAVVIPLPPQNGGAVGWGNVYLSFGADFGDVTLRVAIYNSPAKAWRLSQITAPAAGDRATVQILDGDQKVSVGRVSGGPADTGRWPCSWMVEAILHA